MFDPEKILKMAKSMAEQRVLAQLRPGDYLSYADPENILDHGPCLVVGKTKESITVVNLLHSGTRTYAMSRGGDAVVHPLNDLEGGRKWTESAWDVRVESNDAVRLIQQQLTKEEWWLYSVFSTLVQNQTRNLLMGQLPDLPEDIQRAIDDSVGEEDQDGSLAWGQSLDEDEVRGLVLLSIHCAYWSILDPNATEWVEPAKIYDTALMAKAKNKGFDWDAVLGDDLGYDFFFGPDFDGHES
jgi:hypothetical protein